MTGVSTIILAEFLGNLFLSSLILFTTAVYLVSEYLRLHKKSLPVVTRITALAVRSGEGSGWILRPVSYAAGIIIAVNLFPKPINYAAIAVLTVADGLATFVGVKFGRHHLPYNHDKTFEGSTSFFLASLFSTLIFVNAPAAILGSIVGTIAESFPMQYSENIIVPIAAGLCMSISFMFL